MDVNTCRETDVAAELKELGIPCIMIANKVDLLKTGALRVHACYAYLYIASSPLVYIHAYN